MNWHRDFKKIIRGTVRFKEPLKLHTTFRIGGPSDVWVEPYDLHDLIEVIKIARSKKKDIFVIGSGSNILARDGGFRGIVVCLNSRFFQQLEFCGSEVTVAGGLALNRLVNRARHKNLSGCEFLAGIPGTVGGAIVSNAGVGWMPGYADKKRANIADLIDELTVLEKNAKTRVFKKSRGLKFGYRDSNLSRYIILSAKLKLRPAKRPVIDRLIKQFLAYRRATQDLKSACAGCIFKNPTYSRMSSGRLIELCGLKGKRIGNASISVRHANFIINQKNASARDVLRLMRIIQNSVKNKFKIYLEPEIKIIGRG
jgi:UDP-N-acetylmuramate dehydrogenase